MSKARPVTLGERFLVGWGSLVLIVASLYWAKPIVVPLILAVLLTFILSPLVTALQHRGFGRVCSTMIVVFLVTALLAVVGWTFTWQMRTFVAELPEHKHTIIAKIEDLQAQGHGSFADVLRLIKDITEEVQPPPSESPAPNPLPVVVQENAPAIKWLPAVLGAVAEVLATAALVMVLVLFMLIQRETLRNRVLRLLSHCRFTSTTHAIDDATRRISNFLVAQLCINAGFAAALGCGLVLAGFPYALLWAALAGAFRFIPYLGVWLVAVPSIVFSLAVFPSWTEPAIVLGLFLALELLVYYAVEPLFMRHGTGVSAVALLLAATFWAWLWGPVGLILSTPMTVCLVVLGKHVPQLEFLGILLGDEPCLAPWETFYQRLLARDDREASDLIAEYLGDHEPETLGDEVLLPALVQLKRDTKRRELDGEARDRMVQVIRSIIDNQVPRSANAESTQADEGKVVVVACPAADEIDELALELLAPLLNASRLRFIGLSSTKLAAEMLAAVRQEPGAVIVIAGLQPGGLAHVRYLCKRLRRAFPHAKIVAGFWGHGERAAMVGRRLREAGADQVGTSLRQTRDQVLPFTALVGREAASRLQQQH